MDAVGEEKKKRSKKPLLIMMVLAVILMAAGAYVYLQKGGNNKEFSSNPSAGDLEKVTVETQEITTNLADQSYIKAKFRIQTNSEEAKQELEKRLFQVNNLIIYELSGLNAKQLSGTSGISRLEMLLKKRAGTLMQEGSIKKVYTVEKIVQ